MAIAAALLLGFSARASLIDTSSPPAPALESPGLKLPARIVPRIDETTPDGVRLEEANETDFSIPADEIHAAGGSRGSRLVTGTQDGELTAFSIKRAGASYEVVELSQAEVAWQLSKILFSWCAVASLLFAGLFACAEKSKRHKRINGLR